MGKQHVTAHTYLHSRINMLTHTYMYVQMTSVYRLQRRIDILLIHIYMYREAPAMAAASLVVVAAATTPAKQKYS